MAAGNFLNALEKIPGLIEQEQKKITAVEKDIPVLREVVNSLWTKENILSELKNELAAVDRKIQLSITPENKELLSDESKETIKIDDVQVNKNTSIRLKTI